MKWKTYLLWWSVDWRVCFVASSKCVVIISWPTSRLSIQKQQPPQKARLLREPSRGFHMNTTTIIRNSSNGNENKKIAPEVGTWPGFFLVSVFLTKIGWSLLYCRFCFVQNLKVVKATTFTQSGSNNNNISTSDSDSA